jgi:ATP-binding cassette subfamily F protein 3
MLAIEHLSIQFGGRYLFRDVTFTVSPGERVAVVGPNGAGKSTLFRIIAGLQVSDEGDVKTPKDFTMGYLPQEPNINYLDHKRTLLEEACTVRKDLMLYQERMDKLHEKMSEKGIDHHSDEYLSLLERFSDEQHRFEHAGGFLIEAEASKILSGLGFTANDLKRHPDEFSGGWLMRLELAKLLILSPNILLLDEPTNHLDLESLIWIEDFVKAYRGALLIISHDRTFLNAIATRTVEISGMGKVESFAGNYDFYEKSKAEREALLEAQSQTLGRRRKEIESFIERFRYKATKARQAQSRIKMLERMERVELSSDAPAVHFTFPASPQSGRWVFELAGAAKSYDGVKNIFTGCDLAIERGDRVAFVGKNGEGKTTLGKILVGEEKLTGGDLKEGYNVTIGYYAQHQADELNPDLTVLGTVDTLARAMFFRGTGSVNYSETQLRTLLGAFLFRGDDVHKPVRVLSGGEKSRLAIAKMLLEPSNTLILDEPTNHLDMRSKEVLKQALMAFEGTVIVISHDRDFLDELTDRTIVFEGGHVKEYMKPLEQYLEELHDREISRIKGKPTLSKKSEAKGDKAPERATDKKERKRQEAEERNVRSKKEKPFRDKLKKIESQIALIETEKTNLEMSMSDPDYYNAATQVQEDTAKLREMEEKLNHLYYDWSKISEEMEAL